MGQVRLTQELTTEQIIRRKDSVVVDWGTQAGSHVPVAEDFMAEQTYSESMGANATWINNLGWLVL
jgi:hypothetical protein